MDIVSDDGTHCTHTSDKFNDKLKSLNDAGVGFIQQE